MVALFFMIVLAALYSYLLTLTGLGLSYLALFILIGIVGAVLTYALFLLILIFGFFKLGSNNAMWKHHIVYDAMRLVLFARNTSVKVYGRENIPHETYVCMANHKDNMDAVISYVVYHTNMAAAAKKELGEVPVLKSLFKTFSCITINRENNREGAMALLEGIKYVKAGKNYLIFPEGGVKSREVDTCVDLKPGALKLATKANAVISPFTINNSVMFTKRKNWFKHINIIVKIHPPIYPKEYENMNSKELGLYVEEIINGGVINARKEK